MGHFVITFRFKSDDSYDERYNSFCEKVAEIAQTHPWSETSSFFALEADETARSLCSRLYLETKFSENRDQMLVIDLFNQESATKGTINYPSLLKAGLGF